MSQKETGGSIRVEKGHLEHHVEAVREAVESQQGFTVTPEILKAARIKAWEHQYRPAVVERLKRSQGW